jgi:hypothetical protein
MSFEDSVYARGSHEPIYAETLSGLRGMTDEQIVAAHDGLLDTGRYPIGPDYYLTELARRDANRQTRTLVCLTKLITVLTVVNVAAVIYSIAH